MTLVGYIIADVIALSCRLIIGVLAVGGVALPSGLQLNSFVTCTFDTLTVQGERSCRVLSPKPASQDDIRASTELQQSVDLSGFTIGIQDLVEWFDCCTGPEYGAAYFKSGSADTSLLVELTTPGPPRTGIAQLYLLGGFNVYPSSSASNPISGSRTGSIGGYAPPVQSGRVRPVPTVVPFDLGVPFEIALAASVSASQTPPGGPYVGAYAWSSATIALFELGADGSPGAAVPIFITPEPSMSGALVIATLLPAISNVRRFRRRIRST